MQPGNGTARGAPGGPPKAEPGAGSAGRGAGRRRLDDAIVGALTAPRKLQLAESSAAGQAYRDGLTELGWYSGGEDIVTDQLSIPVHPEWYSDESADLSGVPPCAGSRCMIRGRSALAKIHKIA